MAENYFGITDTGKMRTNNEDNFFVEKVHDQRFIAACVIDGVGGYEGGEVAAQLAHDAILKCFNQPFTDVISTINESLAAANEAIYREKQDSKSNEQMACVLTLAIADIQNNKFYYGHVGDTRLYLLRDNSLIKITRDHSFVGFLEDSGRLTEEAAMRHPKRNEINKALGFDAQIRAQDYIETGESPFLPGDMILLCSDGLTDMIDNNAIKSILLSEKSMAAKGKLLISSANDAGGKDNITVVMVQNDKSPSKHEATKPAAVKKNEVIQPAPVNYKQTIDTGSKVVAKKKKSSIFPFIMFLLILIVGAIGWLVYQNYYNKKQHQQQVVETVVEKKRNPQEQGLIDSILGSQTGEVFVLNQPGEPPIVITDSIIVDRDSMHIIGNGVTLTADSTFKGPALTLTNNCRYLLLDSIIIENFDIGVLASNRGLHLKNVQFRNCRVPVQYQLLFKDRPVINGRFADTVFFNSDSIQ